MPLNSAQNQKPDLLTAAPGLAESLQETLDRAGRFLLGEQREDGHWCGELEADTTLESDTIKWMHLLDRVDPARQEKMVRGILKSQLPSGGWPIYRGGPAELNATVKAYVALRLAGHHATDHALVQAKEAILRLGGLEKINSFEKVYLALFNCYPWSQVPAIPPELALLPHWFPFNIYEVAYWSRTILVPLSVLYAVRPELNTGGLTLEELWVRPARKRAQVTNFQRGGLFWRFFFLATNHFLKLAEAFPIKPFRARALRHAERWIRRRLSTTDGLGAIFPAMVNGLLALKALGYEKGNPVLEDSIRQLERLELDRGETVKVQPCFSPVWDTAIAIYALEKTGLPGVDAALKSGTEWLRQNEIRQDGDWQVKNRYAIPGGWAFEYRNPFYPDVDDTAQVLLALWNRLAEPATQVVEPYQRGLSWIISMQNQDGGWSSYDKDNNKTVLNHFPFADHNAMLDPSANDITGRILELLGKVGIAETHPALRKGIDFLYREQESDGTWFGRWGVNYIYGTWLALRGLAAVGEPMHRDSLQRAGNWLEAHQNEDGGWGESCLTYDDPSTKGQGVSTASQTAWAVMSLLSLKRLQSPALRRGLDFLIQTQKENGDWPEESFTGTGFPRVFYLKYHYYRNYFPLLALTEAREILKN